MNLRHSRIAAMILGIAFLSPAIQAQTPSKATRDPFVNLVSPNHNVTRIEPENNATRQTPRPTESAPPIAPAKPNEPAFAAPQVSVQGIVLSASGNQAILSSPKQTYVVKAGDSLGDYKVQEVQTSGVVLRYKDRSFQLKIQDPLTSLALAGKKK